MLQLLLNTFPSPQSRLVTYTISNTLSFDEGDNVLTNMVCNDLAHSLKPWKKDLGRTLAFKHNLKEKCPN